jgi:serine/threonine-protein kinase
MTSENDGMTMVFVPEGEFTMGSNNSGQSDERPEHQVNLDAFWIDQTEVTNAMYEKCVSDGDCQEPNNTSSYTHSSYYGNPEFDNFPVIYVDWNQANAYCSWAGRRLPTEAEWEKAARGEDAFTHPWGNDLPNNNLLNFNAAIGDTTEVGAYPNGASPYGALDMAGNVWEWVSSLYQSYPYDANDGRENLSDSGSRPLRGGAWNDVDNDVRSADRFRFVPTNTVNNLGFRCARSP